ncbi:MAG: cardiolipin synthase B [Acidobacteriia bacterium]|nr:cardiolipin synthase B [Terriglobia bacterium]
MAGTKHFERDERDSLRSVRELANQAFSRAAGAPLIPGNHVRLLKDARENYPAWLAAIRAAKLHIHFESYIIHEDEAGLEFADALLAKAAQGVRVRVVYDWLGGFGKTSRRFWNRLRAGGIEVRCYNPPQLDSPFGWVSRDHRKMIGVDGEVGFITGLCVGKMWVGDPARKIEPWRDTGVEVRGNAVAHIERAFAQVWAMLGEPIPEEELINKNANTPTGAVSMRVVATVPATAGMIRFDELVAALARKRLWLTDAYYAGTSSFVQALKAAAKDGVDVRLLVPNGTDIPIVRLFSRAGYRPLLESGVRVFEWNGTMLHAKTSVADGHWARVGSTNLNVASWFSNCELDAIIEDEPFAQKMEEMYLQDLANATEVVLSKKHRVRAPGEPLHPQSVLTSGGGSAGRVAAGAVRIGHAIGASFTNRRKFEPVEGRIMVTVGALLFGLAILLWYFPAVLVYPMIVLSFWLGAALLFRAYKLNRKRKRDATASRRLRT